MIIYKREITRKDVDSLVENEDLIHYKTDDVAIVVCRVSGGTYIVRKRRIDDNELIEEAFFKTIDETMDFVESL